MWKPLTKSKSTCLHCKHKSTTHSDSISHVEMCIHTSDMIAACRIQACYRNYRQKRQAIMGKYLYVSKKLAKQKLKDMKEATALSKKKPSNISRSLILANSLGFSIVTMKPQKTNKRKGLNEPLTIRNVPEEKLIFRSAAFGRHSSDDRSHIRSYHAIDCSIVDGPRNAKVTLLEKGLKMVKRYKMSRITECVDCTDYELLSSEDLHQRPSYFLNVLRASWLLARVEDRYNLPAQENYSSNYLQFWKPLTDIAFSLRSGLALNLYGRLPLPSLICCNNILKRIEMYQQEQSNHIDTGLAQRILKSMRSELYLPAVRCFGYILTKIWRVLFAGLNVDPRGLKKLDELIRSGKDKEDICIVLAPTHKTHLDYLIISYICFAYHLPLPRIAAGNNLDLPIIGTFLRYSGSFFIRRIIKTDALYKKMLSLYVKELLKDGNPLEVFLEGGRSRVGRVCPPKLGFLSILKDYASVSKKRMFIVPIALDYDHILESHSYAHQRLGKQKVPESIFRLLNAVGKLFFTKCGNAYVRFGSPVQLHHDCDVPKFALSFGNQLQKLCTATTTSIVASLLLWKRHISCRVLMLHYIKWLVTFLDQRQIDIGHLPKDANTLLDHGLKMLQIESFGGDVISYKACMSEQNILITDYYRSQLAHHFLPRMALLGALQSLQKDAEHISIFSTSIVAITEKTLLKRAQFLWQYIQKLAQCDNTISVLTAELSALCESSPCLSIKCINGSNVYIVQRSDWRTCRNVQYILSYMWPLADTMSIACQIARQCIEQSEKSGESFVLSYPKYVERAQKLARDAISERTLAHLEVLCKESLSMTLNWLIELQVVNIADQTQAISNAKEVLIACPYSTQTASRLMKLIHRVETFRKPIKHMWIA